MSDPAKYVVGWICAIATEYVAAQVSLDEKHEGPIFVSPNDTNHYTLGRFGEHNVVIAVLPDGEYGTVPAASVVTSMLNSFPNVRIGLMVGIGGGVPSEKHDIRLGDVVVSASRGGQGGVFQYDFGKSIQGRGFEHTRVLNQPPTSLRTAVMGIQTQYEINGHRLDDDINSILDKNARLRRKYGRPEPSTDRLFRPEAIHDLTCGDTFCAYDCSNLIPRIERTEHDDNPAIHYGLIASGNQLMKDASIRDSLAAEKDVLCFEMEAAGLVNHFPCLVIRGICDYSDSHKCNEWQGYASMVAAVYTKDLLRMIRPNKVEAEKRISDILSDLYDVAENHEMIARKQLELQENAMKQNLSDEEQKCLQLFRLTSSTKDATYEWYKDRVDSRVEGTCEWFLKHENFQKWLQEDSGPLLVSADPGCGKSVLAKYLIDDGLPDSVTICYFFFKNQDQNTVRQALCALIHQLFSQNDHLIKHAIKGFKKDGPGVINSTKSLWNILSNAVQDFQAASVIIVLDALDECADSELEDLIRNIESQFRSNHAGHSKLKYFLTSRPYDQIMRKFTSLLNSFPYIRIPGEEESESISLEVNHVIMHRVEQLAKEKRLSDLVKSHLAKKLLRIPHRTYLWVYLVFDFLTIEDFKKTQKGVDSTITSLPTNIYEAYERILENSKKDPMVRRALSIILAASRPLTVSEMNIALNVHWASKSMHDLDLEDDEDFRSRLRTWCGLFISIHHDKVYFLHQTAREFLLVQDVSPAAAPPDGLWRHSITSQSAHNILAEVCVQYLDLFNDGTIHTDFRTESRQNIDTHPFLNYSAGNWVSHYQKACLIVDADLIPHILRLCNRNSRSRSAWLSNYLGCTRYDWTKGDTSLIISSLFGLEAAVVALLANGEELNSRDHGGRTPLSIASAKGHDHIVKLLLEKGADIESRDHEGWTPLSLAANEGHEAIVKLLLAKGVDPNSRAKRGWTPLIMAARNGYGHVVKLLLERGADFELKEEDDGRTPLSFAAENGNETIIKLLLEKGAAFDSSDVVFRTPLSYAAENGNGAIVKLLLEKGADFDSRGDFVLGDDDDSGNHCGPPKKSPLTQSRLKKIIEMLHEISTALVPGDDHYSGDDHDFEDDCVPKQQSPTTKSLFETMIKPLRAISTALNPGDDDWAPQSSLTHQLEIEKQLAFHFRLEKDGRTPLSFAAENGHEDVVKILLERGAEFESIDINHHMTPLLYATKSKHENVVKLLLENGAYFESRDCRSQTSLSYAAGNGHVAIVELLLEKGANVDSRDLKGDTPLSSAAESGHEAIVKLLLENGADFGSKGFARSLMSWAAENGYHAIVQLLLVKGAKFNFKDDKGRTPLSCAAENGHKVVVKLLFQEGCWQSSS